MLADADKFKTIAGFFGSCEILSPFIAQYSIITAPLTDILRKDAFLWSEMAEQAFSRLKDCIMSAPVLHLPNFSKSFYLDTDASGVGIGAVLHQENHPVAFFSKKLSDWSQKCSAYAREMMTITEAVSKFRHYLFGHFFVIHTGHRSLHHLTDQTIQTPDQEEWLPKLMGFHFRIEYKPGKANVVAGTLSHCFYMALLSLVYDIVAEIKSVVAGDSELATIFAYCNLNSVVDTRYSVRDGILCWKDRVGVPSSTTDIQRHLLLEYHASPVGGHASINRTEARLAALFFWPSMRRDVQSFVQQCHVCQQAKHSKLSPAGLLQALPIPQ